MYAYKEKYPVGTQVRIADRESLEDFRATWKYHNPLQPEQINYASEVTTVKKVGFYHGGDVLYELKEAPGIWHEACLRAD